MVGAYSNSPKTAQVKLPWGQPVKCDFIETYENSQAVQKLKFTNRRHETLSLDIFNLNNLKVFVDPFSQRITSMKTQKQCELLSSYLSLLNFSIGFIHHREEAHDSLGFRLDGQGVTLSDIEARGGNLENYKEFVELATTHSGGKDQDSFNEQNYEEKSITKGNEITGDEAGPSRKIPKHLNVKESEIMELQKEDGLEKTYQRSYVGRALIPLKNIEVHDSLVSSVNLLRVSLVVEGIKKRYDPSQSILVVVPEESSKVPNLRLIGDQNFRCVQKVQTFVAFLELDKKAWLNKTYRCCTLVTLSE